MARIISILRKLFWEGVDCLFPIPTPPTQAQKAKERKAEERRRGQDEALLEGLSHDTDDLTRHLASCTALVAAEQQRRESVDARLTTIIGLSSIAGTIVLGTMLSVQSAQGLCRALLALLLLYLSLQVCSAILAAVNGLGRRAYLSITPQHVLPVQHEANAVHLRRQIRETLRMHADHRQQHNVKVTYMAAAHRATKNFVAGLVLLAAFGTWQRLASVPSDELLDRIRRDHELRELLRGPQGQPGISTPCPTPTTATRSKAPPKSKQRFSARELPH